MHILIFGKSGQLGTALSKELESTAHQVTQLGREEADLALPDHLYFKTKKIEPDVVIIAAAYTAVDKAEEDIAQAEAVNVIGPSKIAQACKELDIPLIHISTDFVFNGQSDDPYTENMKTDPINVYGRTKLEGEQAIANQQGRYAILRTSWVFSEYGNNFVKAMLRLSETRDALNIVADQIGQPTEVHDLAKACLQVADKMVQDKSAPSGIYHFSGKGPVSWADFARAIFAAAGKNVSVTDIPATEFPTPAARPAFSVMNCEKIHQDYAIIAPDWQPALARVIAAL